MKFVLVTPVKNERDYFPKTIESVINQTCRPSEWIIVNDNCTDGTGVLIDKAVKSYSWIKSVIPAPFQIQDYSSRVVHLFNYGMENLTESYELIGKLDADVSFEKDFFEKIIREFKENKKLGIASGHLMHHGKPEELNDPYNFFTRGATKMYRLSCLEDIEGLFNFRGWDTLDTVAARGKGWETRTLPVYFEHLKEEGVKAGSKIKNHYRTGKFNGSVPYLASYFFAKAFSKIIKPPFLIGSLVQVYAYIVARYVRRSRIFPDYVVRQLHKEQKQILLGILKSKN